MRPRAFALLLVATGCLDWNSLYQGRCGNGVVEAGEECDDDNVSDGDGCLSTCRWATCGDGKVRAGVEECDDGNGTNGDTCNARCLRCEAGAAGNARFTWADNGHCYSRHDAPLPWDLAVDACRAVDAYPVAYNSLVEFYAMDPGLLAGTSAPYWIGLYDPAKNGMYAWITHEPFRANSLDSWSPDTNPDECVVQKAALALAQVPCDGPAGALCENGGWVLRSADNHAYRAFFGQAAFADARHECELAGAHMLTITSTDEQEMVSATFFGSYWIGAQKASADKGFEWVTGEALAVQVFAEGEPDLTTLPACVVIGDDHRWHDRVCDGSKGAPYGVICEID